MEELEQVAVDSAILLENAVEERVSKVVNKILKKTVEHIVDARFKVEKEAMLLEIAIAVGKILKQTEEEERKPLWEYTPEEFNFTKIDLEKHMLEADIKSGAT